MEKWKESVLDDVPLFHRTAYLPPKTNKSQCVSALFSLGNLLKMLTPFLILTIPY